jgi:hypothetical protein
MCTAYSADGVTGVTLLANVIYSYSQRNEELGLENYGIVCGGELNVIF